MESRPTVFVIDSYESTSAYLHLFMEVASDIDWSPFTMTHNKEHNPHLNGGKSWKSRYLWGRIVKDNWTLFLVGKLSHQSVMKSLNGFITHKATPQSLDGYIFLVNVSKWENQDYVARLRNELSHFYKMVQNPNLIIAVSVEVLDDFSPVLEHEIRERLNIDGSILMMPHAFDHKHIMDILVRLLEGNEQFSEVLETIRDDFVLISDKYQKIADEGATHDKIYIEAWNDGKTHQEATAIRQSINYLKGKPVPEHFIAGYWIIDWKGIANLEVLYNVMFNHKCALWVFQTPGAPHSAQDEGFHVGSIMVGAEDETSLEMGYHALSRYINIIDWHIPPADQRFFWGATQAGRVFGQIHPTYYGQSMNNTRYDLKLSMLRSAEHNERLLKKLDTDE